MNNSILKIAAVSGLGVLFAAGCQDKEAELLAPKVYFENVESTITVGDDVTEMTLDLQARLTSKTSSDVNVTYSIADESVVETYNKKYGKEYVMFPTAALEVETSTIPAGDVYASVVKVDMTGLDAISGKTCLLPIRVNTGDVPVIDGSDIAYFIITTPVKITNVALFSNNYFKVPISPLNVFNEVTYEAIINVSSFGNNNTIMGCEGVMIMRIGDAGGGTVPRDILQVAGKSEMTWSGNPISTGKWYHVAFTCNASGDAHLYVNGAEVINGSFAMSADLTANSADYGFSVGMVPRFMWGTRPFYGYMSEVRLWDVVRTADQIKNNMLSVDPATPGLVAYYKLNGDLNDSSPNGYNPTDYSSPAFETIEVPIAIGGSLTGE